MVKTRIRCAGGSDPGKIRSNNEDAWYADPDRGIFLVVDGIGGQSAGEKAAGIALERVRARLERQTGTTEQRIREAITVANNEIFREAQANPEWHGMACVLTLAVIENGSAVVGHVGDSRLYQIRGQAIRKITHDHSPVGEREDNRELSEAEAMRHPRRNEVFRDVGSEEHAPDDDAFIEVQRFAFDPDSALVLCSDGLSDQVTSNVIRRTVERNAQDPERAVRELIDAANLAGGKDNVTVVVVEGEQFTAPVVKETSVRQGFPVWVIPVCLIAATLSGLAGRFIAPRTIEVPVLEPPRVRTVEPGQTIAAALATARAGDTVEVSGGEYNEEVRLKDGVTLRSRVPREAILRGPVSAAGPSRARLSGFTIRPDPQSPIPTAVLIEDSAVEIDDVDVSGAAVCIEIRGAASPSIRASAIHDCTEAGVLIAGTATSWLAHNSIHKNKVGIAVRGGARPSLLQNVFDRSPLELPPDMSIENVRALNLFPSGPPRGKKK